MKYLSPLLSDARASIGGATASKNRGGNYFRARVAPVQPRSVAQQEQRANLAALSGGWKGLTQSQRDGWSALASGITLKDSLGNSYKPSGSQLYVGNNRNLSQIGETVVDDAPTSKPDFEDITPLGLTATAGTPLVEISTGLSAAPTGTVFLIKASPQLSPGISFVGLSRMRVIQFDAASLFATLIVTTNYTARFGAPVAGSGIFVAVTQVDIATGFSSTVATASTIVAA
jgi:hypothetical protein